MIGFEEIISKYDKNGITLSVFDKEIIFDKSVFPTSIKIKGEEILYKPIELNTVFGEINGEWDKFNIIPVKNAEDTVSFTISQTTQNIILNADITIECDGFIRFDLRLMSFWSFHKDNKPRLSKMWIDIPLKKEYSTLMHYWPNCESGVCLSGKVLNSHATPDGKTNLPFKPYIWTGWEYGGLGFCCECDKNFEINNSDECITITSGEECTNIRISLLDHTPTDWSERRDEWGNNINPITYSFAFQPTPVKKFDEKNLQEWRAFHLYDVPKHPIFEKVMGRGDTLIERIAQSGAQWLILHEDWSLIQNYGLPENEEVFKRFVNDCHKIGLKVMVYFGYELSSLYPGFNDVCQKYLNKNINGNFVGGWQREPMQRDFTVCYHGNYSEMMIRRVEYVMDTYGVDGIYTDGTYVPWECANETHGCGYRDVEGRLHYTYPIFSVREHVKKLYEAVHSRGGRIDTHQSSCCMMATLAFADSYFDGENIQTMIQEDISKLKADTFRTEFMGLNMGIPCHFISYTGGEYTIRLISGITLIHNVFPRANRIEDIDYISELWKIYDNFGIEEAKWYPYWEEQGVTVKSTDTYLSYYKKENSLLLIITSYNKDINELRIELDGIYQKAEDLLDKENIFIKGNTLQTPIKYANVKLIKISGKKGDE